MGKSKQKNDFSFESSDSSSSSSASKQRGSSSTPAAKKQKMMRDKQKQFELKTLTLLRVQLKGYKYKQGTGTARTILKEVTKLVEEHDSLKAEMNRIKESSASGPWNNPCCRQTIQGMLMNLLNLLNNGGLTQLAGVQSFIPGSNVGPSEAIPAPTDVQHFPVEHEYSAHGGQAIVGFDIPREEETNNVGLSSTDANATSNPLPFQSEGVNEINHVNSQGVRDLPSHALDMPGKMHKTELETLGCSSNENEDLSLAQQIRQVADGLGNFMEHTSYQETESTVQEQSQFLGEIMDVNSIDLDEFWISYSKNSSQNEDLVPYE